MKEKSGFTLIELSIVLVIIGLIVGGVLVGQDLIQAAKDRAAMSELEKYGVAYNTFRLKYNCIPGDCKNASAFGLGDDGDGDRALNRTRQRYCPGHGSGYVETQSTLPIDGCGAPNLDANHENQHFWSHLSAAGLIADNIAEYNLSNGSGAAFPPNEYFPRFKNGSSSSHYLAAFHWAGKLYIHTGLYHVHTNRTMRFTNASLKGKSVRNITQKLGYEYIEHTNCPNVYTGCSYPDSLKAGHRVIASGTTTAFITGDAPVHRPHNGNSVTSCASTANARYNEDGDCDLIWQID